METFNKYKELVEKGLPEEEIMEIIQKVSRDNARIPMQWDDSDNAGFSTGKPWIDVNENYKEINVKKDRNSSDGIFDYYKSIIAYRKKHYDTIETTATFRTDGTMITMEKEHFIVYANFSDKVAEIPSKEKVLFHNYKEIRENTLRPYEVLYLKNNKKEETLCNGSGKHRVLFCIEFISNTYFSIPNLPPLELL